MKQSYFFTYRLRGRFGYATAAEGYSFDHGSNSVEEGRITTELFDYWWY